MDPNLIEGGIVSSNAKFFTLESIVRDTVGNSLGGMTQSGSGVAGLSFFRKALSSLVWSWKESLECQMFSRLRIEELGAMLTLKHPNHVFSSYLDLNIVDVEEGLDRHDVSCVIYFFSKELVPACLFQRRLKSFVECYMFRKRFVRATLEHPLMKNLFHVSFGQLSKVISKWGLKSYVNCLFDNCIDILVDLVRQVLKFQGGERLMIDVDIDGIEEDA
nr:hypothetical protein [Tanacetum cinerariifolium]